MMNIISTNYNLAPNHTWNPEHQRLGTIINQHNALGKVYNAGICSFALCSFCCILIWHRRYSYLRGISWNWGNVTIAYLALRLFDFPCVSDPIQSLRVSINTSRKSLWTDHTTTKNQSTTQYYEYLSYGVYCMPMLQPHQMPWWHIFNHRS